MRKFLIALIIVGAASAGSLIFNYYKGLREAELLDSLRPVFDDRSIEAKTPQKVYIFDVTSREGIGLAKRTFSIDRFEQVVNIILPEAGSKKYYKCWLSKTDLKGAKKTLALGKLTFIKGEYYLSYESPDDLSTYDHIYITRESLDGAGPGEMVAEANF